MHDVLVVLPIDARWARIQALADAAIKIWAVGDVTEPRVEARRSVGDLASGEADTVSVEMIERVSRTLATELAQGGDWTGGPLDVVLRGLYSAVRQMQRSDAVQSVVDLCHRVRYVVDQQTRSDLPTDLMASLMVVEDAVMAISAYEAAPPFPHVDEAYLAKYGLLQALQAGFDAAEAVCRSVGIRARADRLPGGKSVLVVRNIVAGHSLGGTMSGRPWHHFHDRQSVHDKDVIRVMSFERSDPANWTGQTIDVARMISDGLAVITELLRRAVSNDGPPDGGEE